MFMARGVTMAKGQNEKMGIRDCGAAGAKIR